MVRSSSLEKVRPIATGDPRTAKNPGDTISAGTCSGTPASRPIKVLTITVRDGSAGAKLLFTENATFDSSTG